MPYKPKSLDDINSLYDSDISATRAIEQGRSKVKDDSATPKLNIPADSSFEADGVNEVSDISGMVDEFIRSLNNGTLNRKPSRIGIDPHEAPAKKPGYRPGIKAPRTSVQELSNQQAGGPIVRNPSAARTTEEKPFRSSIRAQEGVEGGPNYARLKADAEEAQRAAAVQAKQKRQDEYRKMLGADQGSRRTSEEMDEFLSEYASVMNDEDEKISRRRRRQERRPSEPEMIAEPEAEKKTDAFESFFNEVTADIPDSQRQQSYILSQTQSDFDGMFDGTDMATLPYSAKQFIYEQKLMYEQQARRAKDEYDRKRADDFARAKAEKDLLRAEQERIRQEAEEKLRRSDEEYLAKEDEFRKQEELLRKQMEEEERIRAEEFEQLRAERDRLFSEHQRLFEESEENKIREFEQQRLREEAEQQRLREYEELKAERDRLADEQHRFEEEAEQQRLRELESRRLIDELTRERDEVESRDSDRIASLEEQLRAMELERQRMEELSERAAQTVETSPDEEPEAEAVGEEAAYEAEEPADDGGEADEFAGLSKSERRKLEKQRAKEEAAINRAAEKEMILEAKERAKAEKLARRNAKKRGAAAPVAEETEEPLQADVADAESEALHDDSLITDDHAAESVDEGYAHGDDPIDGFEIEDGSEAAEALDTEERPAPSKGRNAARVFFRTIFSFVFIASLALLALVASVNPVFKVNFGEEALFGYYSFFTSSERIEGTDINSGDLVIVRAVDSVENGQTLAYVNRSEGYFGFGTKSGVSIDSDGRMFYNFAQGDGTAKENVSGIVVRSVPMVGKAVDLVANNYYIVVAAAATLAIVLLLIVAVAFRNRHKGEKKQAKRDRKAALKAEKLAEREELERIKSEKKAAKADKKLKNSAGVDEDDSFEPETAALDQEDIPADEYAAEADELEDVTEMTAREDATDGQVPAEFRLENEEQEPEKGADDFDFSAEPNEIPVEENDFLPSDEFFEAQAEEAEPAQSITEMMGFNEEEEAGALFTIDEIGAAFSGPANDYENEPEAIGASDEFEDVVSSDENDFIEDFEEESEPAPYEPGDGTFFGDDGGIFGDFESFEDDLDDRRSRRSRKKRRSKKNDKTEKNDDSEDVFGSL